MTIVQHALDRPGGAPWDNAPVKIVLKNNGYTAAGTRETLGVRMVYTSSAGAYSVDLTPQSQIDPWNAITQTGTYYEVTHPDGEVLDFVVNDLPGPLQLRSLLVTSPSAPSSIQAGIGKPAVALGAGQFYGVDSAGNTIGMDTMVAYCEDVSGLAYGNLVNGVPTNAFGCVVSVAPDPRDLSILYQMPFKVSTAGDGALDAAIYEVTSGVAVLLDASNVVGGFKAGIGTSTPLALGSYPLGPVTTERQFVLAGLMFLDAASTLVARIASNQTFARTFMKVVAG
jgi:hypothetical protein